MFVYVYGNNWRNKKDKRNDFWSGKSLIFENPIKKIEDPWKGVRKKNGKTCSIHNFMTA